MKKNFFALFIALTAAMTGMQPATMMAQQAGQPAATTQAAPADTTATDELEVFSDTTTTADTTAVQVGRNVKSINITLDEDDFMEAIDTAMKDPGLKDSMFMGLTLLGILFIVFVLAPLVVLGLLFYFIYKNRKQKVRLAEEAMKHGQPIPEQLFEEKKPQTDTADDIRAKGIRQTCLGVGLMFFLGYMIGNVGIGVGALVAAIGVGNLLIARSQQS